MPDDGGVWPSDPEELAALQSALADRADAVAASPAPAGDALLGACWVCFPRGMTGRGEAGDPAWPAAVTTRAGQVVSRYAEPGAARAPYVAGLLALRVGALLESVLLGLDRLPEVLLLDATARDHPRRCGLALHLGAALDVPTVGVTHRPLLATGDWPADRAGARAPLRLGGEQVGWWLRTRAGTRPLAVHPGWRTDLGAASAVVDAAVRGRRTPEPLRQARHLARLARGGGAR
jgi:deoxyribonuclease V